MTLDEARETIQSRLGDRVLKWWQPREMRAYLEVAPEHIRETTRLLYEELQARLQTASGTDGPQDIEILYHWALDGCGFIISVRTRVDRTQPALESITDVCPAAEWIERELHELLGVEFRDHPDPRHLLLSDDWPEGSYPLRRDYQKGEA